MVEPLSLTLELACDASHAFETWTRAFGSWWPTGHTVSGVDGVEVLLEARAGGRIYERTPDGLEIDWGEITAWEPPTRIAYLWHIRRGRAQATDVEITFVASGPDRCRVDIVHGGWERLGEEARTWRDANTMGWDGILPHFATACDPRRKGRP